MKGNFSTISDLGTRVFDFGVAHKDLFPPSSLGGKTLASLGNALAELKECAAAQTSRMGAAREGTNSKAAARAALRNDLDAVARTARAIALKTPGLEKKFRRPRGHSDPSLLNAARTFAQDAEPLQKAFVEHEMPANFLVRLNTKITDLEHAISNQSNGKGEQVAATASLDAAIEKVMAALQALDAIVPNRLAKIGDDSPIWASWETARRERAARSKAAAAAPAPAASATQA